MAKKPAIHNWRIYEIRNDGRYLGSMHASDGKAAIERAIEEFRITEPHRQRRLVAQRDTR